MRTGWLHKKGAVGKMLLVSCTSICCNPPATATGLIADVAVQGRQWELRWVQLTSQTFTYAKTEKDMLCGRYKVFKTSDLIGTMPGPSNIFQVDCLCLHALRMSLPPQLGCPLVLTTKGCPRFADVAGLCQLKSLLSLNDMAATCPELLLEAVGCSLQE